MKRYIISLLVVIVFTVSAVPVNAYSAQSMVLIEKNTLEILDSVNCEKQLPMASTTKIMTALVVLENSNLDSNVRIPDVAVGVEGSSMYLIKDEVLTVRELLYGLMLTSGNDAANALAYYVGHGSVEAFVSMMNEKSASLGLVNTNFTNPSGLPDDNHYTTAFELAIITAVALDNPIFVEIVSTKTIKISYNGNDNGRTLINHNKLLNLYDYAIGVKTGFTKKAGRCLVGAARKDGVTLICVTLNAGDDWNDHMTAFEYGFSQVSQVTLISAGELEVDLKTPDGIPITATNANTLTSVLYNGTDVTYTINAEKFIYAPKTSGDQVGTVKFFANGKQVGCDTLHIKQTLDAPIKKELLITRIINKIKDFLKRK